MKMRNKALVGLIALMLLVAFCVTGWAEENDLVVIEPWVLNGFDYSASEWYKTEEMRALLVAGYFFDVSNGKNQRINDLIIESLTHDTTYVAEDKLLLYIFSISGDELVIGGY